MPYEDNYYGQKVKRLDFIKSDNEYGFRGIGYKKDEYDFAYVKFKINQKGLGVNQISDYKGLEIEKNTKDWCYLGCVPTNEIHKG
ncbi:MAG: hypothetical protein ACLVME_03435 [Ezakiella coagulans]|uniref:hypothetical protein n=1 Tax=Ezakiella coagulans TaxID=46507 RepID=UPI00399A0F3E